MINRSMQTIYHSEQMINRSMETINRLVQTIYRLLQTINRLVQMIYVTVYGKTYVNAYPLDRRDR